MKKLKRIVASLLAVLMLLGVAPVTALAGEIELHRINTTQQPAEEPAQEPVLSSEDVLPEEDVAEAAEPAAVSSSEFYRIVHLDCGRKYFSVENIKKLIDTAAQYGYNQVQLAFGNGGCRFLLDDMSLSFGNVTMSSDTVRNNITNGNNSFNGDTRYLTQSDMDAIIVYANTKGIEIVPMLNMPGHATAIVDGTDYTSSGNLNVNSETARNYGYALLAKYVKYFKDKGCKFFHFGSDESGYSGDNMTTFLTGCAKVITDAGMTPRAFNDATNVATMPTSVQITYWHQESGSKTASALASSYGMINTHGRWYYVIKGAQNSEIGTKYWQGTVNTTPTSVELPVMKAEKMDKKWVGINEYFDGNPGYGSTVSGSKGVMFCIWCDASQDSYLTDSDVISENENYGALYQIEKLAEHYWGDELKNGETTAPTVTLDDDTVVPTSITNGGTLSLKANKEVTWTTSDPDVIDLLNPANSKSITGTTVTAVAKSIGSATITATDETNAFSSYTINVKAADGSEGVEIKVGESRIFDVTADAGDYITDNNKYIATANVVKGTAQDAAVNQITDANYVFDTSKEYIIASAVGTEASLTSTATTYTLGWTSYDSLALGDAASTSSTDIWTIAPSENGYTIQDASGKYLTIGYLTAALTDTKTEITLSYNTTYSCWDIAIENNHLNRLGGSNGTSAGGYTVGAASDTGSRWRIYEKSTGGNKLTITGTGEGSTEVTVGGVKYTIKVTARETTENKTLAYGGSFSLPEGAVATIDSGSEYVTISNGKVTAGQTDGTAVVNAVTKNVGGKVTARYVYNITVSSINFDEIADLPVQLWITNTWVGADSAPTSLQTVNIAAKDAYSEEGILLSSKVPASGYKKDGEKVVKVIYWKGTALHNVTLTEGGTDYSKKGDDFTRVRYWNNSWQYLYNGEWQSIISTDTVVAYYLQLNNVSPEITTGTQDYGNPPTSHPGNSGNGFTLTAFAVVYPDGTLSRTEQEMYETGMIRGFYGSTKFSLGTIYAENNSEYKISKITLTWGNNIAEGNTGDDWYTKNKTTAYGTDWGVNWNKVTNDAGNKWYDETTYWSADDVEKYGEIPMIDCDKYGLNYTTDGYRAALILIYLEPVASEDNLNVVYWDDDADKQINPNSIQIVVKNGVTYLDTEKGLKEVNPLQAGEITLPDNAYIENSSGVKQTFNKDITIINGVAANYRSGIYKYVGADISTDGKTLTLHYNLKPVTSIHEYVVDFGLPVKFTDLLSWFNVKDVNTVDYLSVAKTNKLTVSTGSWGSIKIDESTWDSMTYTLDKMLSAAAVIPLYCNLKDGRQLEEIQIKVIPATTVYYEDSFVDFYDVGSPTKKTEFTQTTESDAMGVWYVVGNENTTAEQALSKLGDKAIYGYDEAYKNSRMFSMDSAKKVTVDDASGYAQAKFTFKGTGFDVISLTNSDSGAITVEVLKDGTTAKTKDGKDAFYLVNNYYGYKYENGQWVVDQNATTLYQIPVMKVSGLEYGTYTAVITVDYAGFFDKTNDNKYSFWLDAIRIYDPMGENADYTKDNEGYPQYIKLRDEIKNSKATVETTLFIDGAENANVATYANFGPNNEVYLANGQAISFKIPENANIKSVQIGAKAPKGTATMTVNNDEGKVIETATEMYYEISKVGGSFTITNIGAEILSLTNLKITYSTKGSVSLAPMSTEEQTSAVMMVRAMFAPPAPTVFEPETFTVSLKNYKDVYVREYIKVTVTTSDDVKYITVGDKRISRYDDERVWGGFRKGFVKTGKRVWSYYVSFDTAGQQVISVVAYDADGLASEAVENTVNVKPRSAWRGKKSEWHI